MTAGAPLLVPPKNLEDLRSILQDSSNGAAIGLGQKSVAALAKMLASPQRIALHSISEIAHELGVNPSTLTRLGQRLGFGGFIGFQELFQSHILQSRTGYYSAQTLQLLSTHRHDKSKFVLSLAEQEIENVLQTASELDGAELLKAADLLASGRRVYILGLRGSFSIAHFFGYFLGFLRGDVIVLGGAGFTIAEDLSRIDCNDVFVAFSFRPYTNVTIAACKSSRARKVPVIAITDLLSPIAHVGEGGALLVARSPYYFNTALANLLLAQALLTALAHKLGVDMITGLKGVEDQLINLEVETDFGDQSATAASRGL